MSACIQGYSMNSKIFQRIVKICVALFLLLLYPKLVAAQIDLSELNPAIYGAIKNKRYEYVDSLLTKYKEHFFAPKNLRKTSHHALRSCDIKIVNTFVKHGFSMNHDYGFGWRPLHYAIGFCPGHIKYIAHFIDDNINAPVNDGETPLHLAVRSNAAELVSFLLDKGAHVDPVVKFGFKKGYTPLFFAVKNNNVEIVKILLNRKSNLHHSVNYGHKALHIAAMHGHTGIVELLINEGLPPDVTNDEGMTALHISARFGHMPATAALLRLGANPVLLDKKGKTPKDYAIHRKTIELFP